METDHTGGQSHLSRNPAVKINHYMMATEADVMDRCRIVTMMEIAQTVIHAATTDADVTVEEETDEAGHRRVTTMVAAHRKKTSR